jgi:hypothetical protein
MELLTKRRSSRKKRSRGKPIGTEKHVAVLDLVQRYEVVPSTYIQAALQSPEYTETAITDLNHANYIGPHPKEPYSPSATIAHALHPVGQGHRITLLKARGRWLDLKRQGATKRNEMRNGATRNFSSLS